MRCFIFLIFILFFISPIKLQAFTMKMYSNANCTADSFVTNSSSTCNTIDGKLITSNQTCNFQSSKMFIVNFALQYHGSLNFAYLQNCSSEIFPIDCSVPIFGKLFHCFPIKSGYDLYITSNGKNIQIPAYILVPDNEKSKN
jgi:hypothetical protein